MQNLSAAMASPSPPSPHAEGAGAGAAVCCMCGDHGLPGELVRCRRCRVRLQHRYCSDLYPRAAAYRRCNWCLREPPDHRHAGHAAAAVVSNKPEEKRKTESASGSDEERQRQRQEGCSSRRSPAEPVGKKKHKAEEKMTPPPLPPLPQQQQPPPAGAGKGIVADTSDSKEVMRAGKTRVGRVKVRRYKLLAEVISC